MDPNATYAELMNARVEYDMATERGYYRDAEQAAIRMSTALRNLDEWLRHGGFLPDAWQR